MCYMLLGIVSVILMFDAMGILYVSSQEACDDKTTKEKFFLLLLSSATPETHPPFLVANTWSLGSDRHLEQLSGAGVISTRYGVRSRQEVEPGSNLRKLIQCLRSLMRHQIDYWIENQPSVLLGSK
ncbi:hypothetical protein BO71DRAFT_228397 [Aspergillus ellipticus CBS 707.79]|uniref:PiggyBac transposable element-derived protein domain-containing protein n=1 Tax=Aspergillus ellipticus CBS 707.79 TaxID=1448320 RepID=A0A319ETM2_9EURO|nr:hypothetical protein BO71DRAFT_228397 [Aspergillus ellipticus CBS 707.79]